MAFVAAAEIPNQSSAIIGNSMISKSWMSIIHRFYKCEAFPA